MDARSESLSYCDFSLLTLVFIARPTQVRPVRLVILEQLVTRVRLVRLVTLEQRATRVRLELLATLEQQGIRVGPVSSCSEEWGP